MVIAKKKIPASSQVSNKSVEQACVILQNLPAKPKEILSLREAIDLLKEQISEAIALGYSYSEVAKMLSEKGVEISPSTLKYYLSSARRNQENPKSKDRNKQKSELSTAVSKAVDVQGKFEQNTRPIWELFEEFADSLTDEDVADLPTDGAAQLNHYLYGTPKN
jgi:predicted transcriptional regulator